MGASVTGGIASGEKIGETSSGEKSGLLAASPENRHVDCTLSRHAQLMIHYRFWQRQMTPQDSIDAGKLLIQKASRDLVSFCCVYEQS